MTFQFQRESTSFGDPTEEHIFIHLSDIHFKKNTSNDPYDLDVDLRRQLERDAVEFKRSKGIDRLTAILVTGDIAYSGSEEEYLLASDWLDVLADKLDCNPKVVLTTPGNHDIDRRVYNDTRQETLRMWQQRLRSSSPDNLDAHLSLLLRDESGRTIVYEPLRNYNLFAVKFGCDINPERPCWDRTLTLGNRLILRLRGLNSVLCSNPEDDLHPRQLSLGEHQVQVEDDRHIVHITLCHHPPDWLIDNDKVTDYLSDRVHLQLFGHKHSQRIDIINKQIRITAGAVHPERNERNWVPRYNFIKVWAASEDEEQYIYFRVYPRVWKGTDFDTDYQSEGLDYVEHRFGLGRVEPSEIRLDRIVSTLDGVKVPIVSVDASIEIALEESVEAISEEDRPMSLATSYAPILVRRFLNLGVYERNQILIALKLDVPAIERMSAQDILKVVFTRAKERHLLGELWNQIEGAHNDSLYQFNPFIGK